MADTASRNLRAVALHVRAVPRTAMIAAAKASKQVAAEEGARAGGPLVGKKKRGLKLRARDDIRPAGDGVTCRIQGVSPAGWVWRNTGTAGHAIRRRKRGPLRKLTVQHPGTAGVGAWRNVNARLAVIVPNLLTDEFLKALRG